MKILLKIQFVGTRFYGYQCQKNGRSVQETLTEASKKVFGVKCLVTGCSRTDSGVHALGFCCTVEPAEENAVLPEIPLGKIHRAYAGVLPEDISVVAAAEVPDDFHPRYSSKGKRYIYKIWDSPYYDPFQTGRCMKCIFPFTGEKLERAQKAAEYFIGKHDFSSFMASGSKITDAVRTVTESKIYRDGEMLIFSVAADGFLYNMVRIMAGTLIDCAAGRIEPEDIPRMIEACDRSAAGTTAPAQGLYLKDVFYDFLPEWKCE